MRFIDNLGGSHIWMTRINWDIWYSIILQLSNCKESLFFKIHVFSPFSNFAPSICCKLMECCHFQISKWNFCLKLFTLSFGCSFFYLYVLTAYPTKNDVTIARDINKLLRKLYKTDNWSSINMENKEIHKCMIQIFSISK